VRARSPFDVGQSATDNNLLNKINMIWRRGRQYFYDPSRACLR
jgi:hypothetical protein